MRSESRAARRTASTPQPEVNSKLQNLEAKLNEEARRKVKLREQIEEIKSNMSQYAASIAGK